MIKRGWIYLQERFPLEIQSPLILVFSGAGVGYSALLRGDASVQLGPVAIAFISCLIFFLQLRIADEFKDFEEDRQFRPDRPVSRGLVSLNELGIIFCLGMIIQGVLAWWLEPGLLLILIGIWGYLAAMTWEFGIHNWLKAHPVMYLLSHMVIMPLLTFYSSSMDWLLHQGYPLLGLTALLVTSFCNGIVLEIGRKIRSPSDEELGVETYSKLWELKQAVIIWLIVLILNLVVACWAAIQINRFIFVVIGLGLLNVLAIGLVYRFMAQQAPNQGKTLEYFAGIWTLILYLMLGIMPLKL